MPGLSSLSHQAAGSYCQRVLSASNKRLELHRILQSLQPPFLLTPTPVFLLPTLWLLPGLPVRQLLLFPPSPLQAPPIFASMRTSPPRTPFHTSSTCALLPPPDGRHQKYRLPSPDEHPRTRPSGPQ